MYRYPGINKRSVITQNSDKICFTGLIVNPKKERDHAK